MIDSLLFSFGATANEFKLTNGTALVVSELSGGGETLHVSADATRHHESQSNQKEELTAFVSAPQKESRQDLAKREISWAFRW